MAPHSVTLAPAETGGDFGAAWDRLAAGRGTQADIYSSRAWFASWLASVRDASPTVLIPAVLDGDGPVALLPLVRRRDAWFSAGLKKRPRSRVVVAPERPDADLMGALVDQVLRSGIRELSLHRMPTRDPATGAMIAALRAAGLQVALSERSTDNVNLVEANDELARRMRKLQSTTRSRERRITPHWELCVDHYGSDDKPMADGMAAFDVIQERSWKGPSEASTRILRAEFMRRTDELGWAHLAVLSVAGRPVAANSWFRVGDVAIGLSTAYEQRTAALSPGAILHGHVHRAIFGQDPPVLMDMLPGKSPFKDSLAQDRPPLVTVDACRRTVVRGATLRPRVWWRHDAPRAWTRARTAVLAKVPARPALSSPRVEPALVVTPAAEDASGSTAIEVEAGTALRRYLAVVEGAPSAEAVAEPWLEGDRWLLVDDGLALVRVRPGDPATVEDLVPLHVGADLRRALRAVAAAEGGAVRIGTPPARWIAAARDVPPLPWTATLPERASEPRGTSAGG